jgi:hypothetical protein
MKKCPILICTVGSPSLEITLSSIKLYAKEASIYLSSRTETMDERVYKWVLNSSGNFGDAYNKIMDDAFQYHDAVIIANDDICLTPDSYRLILEDAEHLQKAGHKIGVLGARSDNILEAQNIRFEGGARNGMKWAEEQTIKETSVIAPIFAYVTKEAFQAVRFPPINWFSDNVFCHTLTVLDFKHFVSRGYVHHAGSQSVGKDDSKNIKEAAAWLWKNEPGMAKHYRLPTS